LKNLSKEVGGLGIQNSKSGTNSLTGADSSSTANPSMFSAIFGDNVLEDVDKKSGNVALTNSKKAKVLFDYDAVDSNEISVWANQIINVELIPNENDWVLAEAGGDHGKIPKAYIQILDSETK